MLSAYIIYIFLSTKIQITPLSLLPHSYYYPFPIMIMPILDQTYLMSGHKILMPRNVIVIKLNEPLGLNTNAEVLTSYSQKIF